MNIKELYNDKESLKEVQEYLIEFLKVETIRRVFEKDDDMYACGEAKRILDLAFENLDLLYGSKSKRKKKVINEAR